MKKYIFLILIITAFILSPTLTSAQGMMGDWFYGDNRYNNMMGYYSFSPFGFVINVIFWILFVVLIVILIRWIIVGLGGGRHMSSWRNGQEGRENSAMDILKERYAKGEIKKEEFEEKKKDLMQ